MLSKVTIKQKVYFLAIFGALLSIMIATESIYSISKIGTKLEQIAEEDIPLTNAVTTITIHQLDQAVLFERALRYFEIKAHNPGALKLYYKDKKKFFEYDRLVEDEILAAEELAAHVLAIEAEHGNIEIMEEFDMVLKQLKKIEAEHKDYSLHAKKAFKMYEGGDLLKAEHYTEQIEKEQDHLIHELEALSKELEDFTASAALEAEHLEHEAEKFLLIVCSVSTFIFLIVAFRIVRGIVRPLLATKKYAQELSKNNLDVEQPEHKSLDEIHDMMEALSVFKDQAVESKRLRDEQERMKARAEEEKKEAQVALAHDFDSRVGGVIQTLSDSATDMSSIAKQMQGSSQQTADVSNTVAAAATEADSNVQTVAAAAEELSASSSEIARQIDAVAKKSSAAAADATKTSESVNELNTLADSVGEVVGTIKEIAEQTNLLALNATIEAARAGEAGKGFAVVADEVKKLANETATKTEEIDERVNRIQEAIRNSVEAMDKIITNVSEIDSATTTVASAVEEQNAATAEIGRNVTEASTGTQQVSQAIIQVQQNASESGEASNTVLSSSSELKNQADILKIEVDKFLDEIRNG